MDALTGLGQGREAKAAIEGFRQRIAPALHRRQQRLDRPPQPVGPQPLGECVHRHQPADQLGADRGTRRLQQLDQGIPQRGAVGAVAHQTADGHGGPRRILALLGLQPAGAGAAAAGQEAGDPQPTGAVLQLQLQDRQLGVARAGEGMATAHRGHHGGGAAGLQRRDAHQVGVVEIVAGVVGDQITGQQEPQTGQLGGRARPDAGHLGQRRLRRQEHIPTGGAAGRCGGQPQPGRSRSGLGAGLAAPEMQALAQLGHQLAAAPLRMAGIPKKLLMQLPQIIRRGMGSAPGGRLLQGATEKGAEALLAALQIAVAAVALQLGGLLQQGTPGLEIGTGRGAQSGWDRLLRMSCDHNRSASRA